MERRKIEVGLIRGAVVKARMRTAAIVQLRLRTPTGPFFVRFFISIILGLVAEFAFMGRSTRWICLGAACQTTPSARPHGRSYRRKPGRSSRA